MAVIDHTLQMVAHMEIDPNEKQLVSKVTQLQVQNESTDQVIAEVDLDLAAFANK